MISSLLTPLMRGLIEVGGAPTPLPSAYVANGFEPKFVADFSAPNADYFRVAGNDSDFETAFTSDSEGGGLATMVDSSGKVMWRAHNYITYSEDPSNAAWLKTNVSESSGTVTASAVGTDYRLFSTASPPAYEANTNYTAKYRITEGTARYIWVRAYSGVNGRYVVALADLDTESIVDTAAAGGGTLVSSNVTEDEAGSFLIEIEFSFTAANSNSSAGVGFSDGATLVNLSIGGAAESTTAVDGLTFEFGRVWVYRSDLGGMAPNPDRSTDTDYVPTTTAARYLARRRHHRWNGSAWVPTCLHEPVGATNLDPNSDDLSAWTTSNTTIAKDQTGADGVANSAHSITATANSGTALEQITATSAAHAWGCLMKRITGTGTVEVTVDGGTTWVDVTSELSTSVFLQVSTGAGITVTNPEFGVRLGTSGDVVAVQVSQLEQTSGFISSPIPTNGSTVTRTADTLKGAAASLPYSSTAISMAVKGRAQVLSGQSSMFLAWQQDTSNRVSLQTSSGLAVLAFIDRGTVETANSGTLSAGVGVGFNIAGRFVGSDELQSALGGTAGTAESATMPALPPLSDDDLEVFVRGGTAFNNGTVDTIRLWSDDIAEAGLEESTA